MRIFLLFAALFLLAGCNNTQKTPTETAASDADSAVHTPVTPTDAVPLSANASEPAAPGNATAAVPAATTLAAAEPKAQSSETSPAILFQKCAACHGSHAEKSALNQSAVIGEWDSKRIADAIIGYQDGTFGGAMKTLMQNQVKGLTPVEVQALSEYIANLYVKTH